MSKDYRVVQAAARLPVPQFVRRYVELSAPDAGCRGCPDYGQFWTCPPYDFAAADYWAGYGEIVLRGLQFHFTPELLARRFPPEELAEYCRALLARHARRMTEHLSVLHPGAAILSTGGCTLCPACTRPAGRPCRHPESLGYSLESLGCDVGAAARGELGWELLWAGPERLPRYLTLLCAALLPPEGV